MALPKPVLARSVEMGPSAVKRFGTLALNWLALCLGKVMRSMFSCAVSTVGSKL